MTHLSRTHASGFSNQRRVSDWDSQAHGLGLEELDHDHKLIFITLGALENELKFSRRGSTLSKAVKFLDHLTVRHFAREEHLMERLGYPGAGEHREQHGLLKAWMDAVLPSLSEVRRPSYDDAVVAYMADWWNLHTERHDKSYGRFAVERQSEALAILKDMQHPQASIC